MSASFIVIVGISNQSTRKIDMNTIVMWHTSIDLFQDDRRPFDEPFDAANSMPMVDSH
jgi:hypothetical protein